MFEELWANIQENYYNSKLNGIDWKAIRKRYHSYLPYINSRDDFRRMVNDMLGELNSSHMGFYTSGPESQEFYKTVTQSTGILYQDTNPYLVARVVAKSPADIAAVDIRPGDQLVAVNGEKVDPENNRESYFINPDMEEEMSLTFKRDKDTYSIKIHPAPFSSIRLDRYDEWEQHNQDIVDEKTEKQVAYVHMKNMTGSALQDFLIEMTSETYKRDALILDLRYNTGGNVHDEVLQFLSQRPYVKWKYRDGDFAPQPNFAPEAKPIVLLINEQTLSDGEVTAEGFKQLGLGTIVGTETYRWIIFTSGKGLVDGSFYRLPSWGVYTLDGKNLEHLGIDPDIPVDNTFKNRLNGEDPQLQRAIQVVMDKLNSK
jgi:tricorn protease